MWFRLSDAFWFLNVYFDRIVLVLRATTRCRRMLFVINKSIQPRPSQCVLLTDSEKYLEKDERNDNTEEKVEAITK
jgi:hypothetical protein